MFLFPFFVKNGLATIGNSRMLAAAHINPFSASVNTTEPLIQNKLLQSYLEVVNYFRKKFLNDQAMAKMIFKVLRSIYSARTTPLYYTSDIFATSCKVADVYDEITLNNSSINCDNPFISHSLRK